MFHLRIHQEDQLCFFDLSWGRAQRLSRKLRMPDRLMALYRDWQHAYLSFYQPVSPEDDPQPSALRGKVAAAGAIATPNTDWHSKLVEAETRLLFEFHRWLQQAELFDLYTTIAKVSHASATDSEFIDIFLTCTPIELARLPWEAWELGASFASNRKIRMARVPANLYHPAPAAPPRSRPRILVILGSDGNQDFIKDWQQIERSLGLAELQKIAWNRQSSIAQFKQEIAHKLLDPEGWDVLFFAGHSAETSLTGGAIGIAPGASIQIAEIAPQLAIARERGLQFALFNSCSGLSLAESLIELGLSQVAVMREPVPNRVAQEFLVQFLQGLAEHQDVHEALQSACQFLKTEKNLTHPSAHLVPSLFRYPEVALFKIPPPQRSHWIRRLKPKRYEAIALLALLLLGWQLPMQQWLLERRILAQAVYRQATQRAVSSEPPPVLLVLIDNESLKAGGIFDPVPIPYDYLGEVVARTAAYQPQWIGVDYILDRPQTPGQTRRLSEAVQAANQQGTQFVFGALYNQGAWEKAMPEVLQGNLSGDIAARSYHMDLPDPETEIKPFAYALAENAAQNWQTSRTARSLVTRLSYLFGQRWLDPIVDYSLPPDQIYRAVPAWKLLLQHLPEMENQPPIVIIAPGGYSEAGLALGQDNFAAPLAVRHWYRQQDAQDAHRAMIGVKFHAYKLHHLLRQRLVVPIPDLWLILGAALAGRAAVLLAQRRSRQRLLLGAIGGTAAYTLLSLELYVASIALMLPIALPLLTFWLFAFPLFNPRKSV